MYVIYDVSVFFFLAHPVLNFLRVLDRLLVRRLQTAIGYIGGIQNDCH